MQLFAVDGLTRASVVSAMLNDAEWTPDRWAPPEAYAIGALEVAHSDGDVVWARFADGSCVEWDLEREVWGAS